MIFYTYDLEHYRDDLRGFYFDLAEVAPGPLVAPARSSRGDRRQRCRRLGTLADRYARVPAHLLPARGRARDRPRARPALPARRPRRTIHHGKGMNVRTTDRALTSSPRDLARTAAPRTGTAPHPPRPGGDPGRRHGHPPRPHARPSRSPRCATGAPSSAPARRPARPRFGDDTDITVVVGFRQRPAHGGLAGRALRLQPALRQHQHVARACWRGLSQLPRRRRALDERRRRVRPGRARARAEPGARRRELHLRRHRDRRRRGDQVHPRRRRLHRGAVQDRRRRARRGRGHQLRVRRRQGHPDRAPGARAATRTTSSAASRRRSSWRAAVPARSTSPRSPPSRSTSRPTSSGRTPCSPAPPHSCRS